MICLRGKGFARVFLVVKLEWALAGDSRVQPHSAMFASCERLGSIIDCKTVVVK